MTDHSDTHQDNKRVAELLKAVDKYSHECRRKQGYINFAKEQLREEFERASLAEPPMSRERFRQEAILGLANAYASLPPDMNDAVADKTRIGPTIALADKLTAAVFDGGE